MNKIERTCNRGEEEEEDESKRKKKKSIWSFSWGYYCQNKNIDKNERYKLLFVHTTILV